MRTHVCASKSWLHDERHQQRQRKGWRALPLVSPQTIAVRHAHFFLLPYPLPCLRETSKCY